MEFRETSIMAKRINYSIIFKVISRNLFIISASLAFCMGIAKYYSESAMPFLSSSITSLSFGMLFYLITQKSNDSDKIRKKEAYLTVTLSWLSISLIGALPYVLSGSIPNVTDAFFESVSGFTTTGSSILNDIEALPKSLLFWRSLTHWIGGIGIIVLVIVVMPTLHIGGYHLFSMESSLQEKIQPKIKSVGNRLLLIYVLLTFAEVLFLLAGHMPLFDSVCHSFGTIATGGFSTKNTSIANYSPYIQYVIMVFMLLAGVNFSIHYFMYVKQFKKVKQNEEFRFYLIVIAIIGTILTLALFFISNKPFELAFRESFFQLISIVTCTGFATADYLLWPTFAWVIIFFAMFLGGSTGSTAGGIKMARHLIVFKNIQRVFVRLNSPNAVLPLSLNKTTISEKSNNSILTFIVMYVLIFFITSMILIDMGLDWQTASSSVATCMAGIGPGLGTVGPVNNFAHLPDAVKLILCFIMLVGRLEIYTIIMLFVPAFWKK